MSISWSHYSSRCSRTTTEWGWPIEGGASGKKKKGRGAWWGNTSANTWLHVTQKVYKVCLYTNVSTLLKHYHNLTQTTRFSSHTSCLSMTCSPVNSEAASFFSNHTADRSHVQIYTHISLTVAAETLICFQEGKIIVMFDMYWNGKYKS